MLFRNSYPAKTYGFKLTIETFWYSIIRQQLAYTEDIRRERCKAPCTRREVWSFNKEVEGQQHFDMPLLLGIFRNSRMWPIFYKTSQYLYMQFLIKLFNYLPLPRRKV